MSLRFSAAAVFDDIFNISKYFLMQRYVEKPKISSFVVVCFEKFSQIIVIQMISRKIT
jgi:hypothetical protein